MVDRRLKVVEASKHNSAVPASEITFNMEISEHSSFTHSGMEEAEPFPEPDCSKFEQD